MACRQIATGGFRTQSVSTRTPCTMLSRAGPRKPGQSASAVTGFAGVESAERPVTLVLAGVSGVFSTPVDATVSGATGVGWVVTDFSRRFGTEAGRAVSLTLWLNRRCSGVGVHRQCKSEAPLPVMTPARTTGEVPQPKRMPRAINARRGPVERRRLATADMTRARVTIGIAKIKSRTPMPAVATDRSTTRDVPNTPATIRTRALRRSDQGALLKNNHQT